MADRLKGITLEIGGDTTKLSKALSGVNSDIINTKAALKDVERLLKLDPTNVDLLRQREKLLTDEVKATTEKLDKLKEAQQTMDATGVDKNCAQYMALQREIIQTEQNLKSLKTEYQNFGSVAGQVIAEVGKKMEDAGGKISAVGDKISGAGEKLMPVTGAIVGVGTLAIKEASDMAESTNKVQVAFGDASDRVMAFSETTLDAYGIAQGTALDMASLFGDMATSMGLVPDEAATLSEKLVGLSGDLASFKNIGVDQAAQALKGIFTGETESLKSLGIVMTQDNLLQYAMEKGMIDTSKSATQLREEYIAIEKAQVAWEKAVKEHGDTSLEAQEAALKLDKAWAKYNEEGKASLDTLSQEELVMLRYNYVMDATTNAQGDFARTSDGTANSMRVMQESLKEAAAAFGELLLPIITPIIQKITELIKWFTNLDEGQKKTILTIAGIVAAVAPVLIVVGNVIDAVGNITTKIGGLLRFIPKVIGVFKTFFGVLAANPIVLVIAIIVAVIAALVVLYNKCEWFRDKVNAVWSGIKDVSASVWNGICKFFTETIPAAWDGLVSFFQGIPEWWNGLWQSIADTVSQKWDSLCNTVLEKSGTMRENLQAVDDFMQGVFAKDWTETFGPVLGGALNNFFDNMEGIWEGVKESMNGVIDVIEGVFSGDWEKAWNGIKDIFGGIFDALFESAKIPLNGIIDFLNAIIDGANWCIEKLNQIPGVNLDTIGDIPFLAKGGTVYSGSAVVGDAGPEILTVAGGKATVTPLTATVDGRSFAQAMGSQAYRTNVQVSFTGSLSQLAAVLQPAIVAETERIGGSFTR